MSILLEKIGMLSTRLIERVAILVSALWVGFSVLAAIELIEHWISGTSDARSQLWRAIFIVIFTISAVSVLFRFKGWRWIVVLPCLFILIRDYFYLMVPQELTWGFDQVLAAFRLAVAIVTLGMATFWAKFWKDK